MLNNLFESEEGKELYLQAEKAVSDFSMLELIGGGVLVGLSGGADSVFLLSFLNKLRVASGFDFKIAAFHLNHSIRGDEADRDEAIAKKCADSLNIEFITRKLDIPKIAKERGLGIEEAARATRYECFEKIIRSRNDLSCVAVAHNSSDNLETVIFNMMRGSGIRGMCGIPPIRDNIIRPLIYIKKSSILSLLDKSSFEYATDTTNLSTDYTRNYIRHKIIPTFSRLTSEPEAMVGRLSENMRCDADFIEKEAQKAFYDNFENERLPLDFLIGIHPAVGARVLNLLAKHASCPTLEKAHIDSINALLKTRHFRYSLSGEYEFVAEGSFAFIEKKRKPCEFSFPLKLGMNEFEGFSQILYLSYDKTDVCYSNVYKFSIKLKVNFDIIDKALFIRNRKDGDSYRFGNMTRKIKKIFNDKGVPSSRRDLVPIIVDNDEIVYVPGFSVADEYRGDKVLYISVFEKNDKNNDSLSFFFPSF